MVRSSRIIVLALIGLGVWYLAGKMDRPADPKAALMKSLEPSPAYLKDKAAREAEKRRAMDKLDCQLQYSHMDPTERDMFCAMMSDKEMRDKVFDTAIDGLSKLQRK